VAASRAVRTDATDRGVTRRAGLFDLSVFHPRLPKVAGRPGWLAADPAQGRRASVRDGDGL